MRISDWSSDVCSSDLALAGAQTQPDLPSQSERSKKLESLFEKQFQMVRDAMAEKGLPAFENNDFSKLYARLAAREQDIDKLRFLFFFQTTKSTQTMSRSEEHTSELQSLMRISYAVFCLKKKKETTQQ